MNSFQNICGTYAARDHIDHVRLGEDGADAADGFRIIRRLRNLTDFFERDAEVAGDVLQELTRSRCTLTGHFIGQHFAAFIGCDRTSVQGANIDHGVDTRLQIGSATRMRRHRVEVACAERNILSITRGCDVVDEFRIKVQLRQHVLIALPCENQWVAPPDPVHALCQPFHFSIGYIEQRSLDCTRAKVDSCCKCHIVVLP